MVPVMMPDVGFNVPWPFVVMQIVIALIGSLSGIIAAVAAARAKRVEKVAEVLTEKQAKMTEQQEVIHKLVNSQSEKLNALTATASFAEGKLQGAADELASATAKIVSGQEAVRLDRATDREEEQRQTPTGDPGVQKVVLKVTDVVAEKPPPQPPLPQR